jgi:hypothetical protein
MLGSTARKIDFGRIDYVKLILTEFELKIK